MLIFVVVVLVCGCWKFSSSWNVLIGDFVCLYYCVGMYEASSVRLIFGNWRAADYLVDMGPGSGVHGGEVVAQRTPKEVMANSKSSTGAYLQGKMAVPLPTQ